MRTYEEVAAHALMRAETLRKERKKRRRKTASALACVLAVLLFAGLIGKTGVLRRSPRSGSGMQTQQAISEAGTSSSQFPSSGEIPSTDPPQSALAVDAPRPEILSETAVPVSSAAVPTTLPPQTTPAVDLPRQECASGTAAPVSPTAAPVSEGLRPEGSFGEEPDGAFSMSGVSGEVYFVRADLPIIYTGEVLTDEDAAWYFREEGGAIRQSLASGGVPVEEFRIARHGYYHLSLGESLTVRQDLRDYLVYNGSRLVAILTLVMENGNIYCTPGFGAPWYDGFSAFLEDHAGQALLFLYCGSQELVLTPEDELFAPQGGTAPESLSAALRYGALRGEGYLYVP